MWSSPTPSPDTKTASLSKNVAIHGDKVATAGRGNGSAATSTEKQSSLPRVSENDEITHSPGAAPAADGFPTTKSTLMQTHVESSFPTCTGVEPQNVSVSDIEDGNRTIVELVVFPVVSSSKRKHPSGSPTKSDLPAKITKTHDEKTVSSAAIPVKTDSLSFLEDGNRRIEEIAVVPQEASVVGSEQLTAAGVVSGEEMTKVSTVDIVEKKGSYRKGETTTVHMAPAGAEEVTKGRTLADTRLDSKYSDLDKEVETEAEAKVTPSVQEPTTSAVKETAQTPSTEE
ncbi:hypothetical protein HK102_011749, partial [Quaeritorhiza haematococci]